MKKTLISFISALFVLSLTIVVSYAGEAWAPYKGASKVTRNMTFQIFYFKTTSVYMDWSTYEHETQVYDKNYANFNGYWSSNLPNPYKDTPFLDRIDTFTIGSADAEELKNYKTYYTRMDLNPGSASTALVRIKGQIGYQNPPGCDSTWCIFAYATTSSLAKFNAPINYYVNWTY